MALDQGWLDVSDPRVVIFWEKDLEREVRAKDPLFDDRYGFASKANSSLVVVKDQLVNEPGARIRNKFRYQLEGEGRAGDQQLKGYGEFYKSAVFDVFVDTLRHYVETPTPITQQWVTEDTMEEGKDGLSDWFATRLGFGAHLHATGLSIITKPQYTINNEIQALNSSYIMRPNDTAAGSLGEADIMKVDIIDEALMRLKLLQPFIKPAKTPLGELYVCFLSPEHVRDLRKTDAEWFSIMKSSLAGGRIDDNPIFTNALGKYAGVLFLESQLVPPGLNAGGTAIKNKTRRAWIGGASALYMAYGRGFAAPGFRRNRFRWDRETEDFGHQHQIAATTITGIARPRFVKPGEASAREAGVFVIETYADHKMTGTDVYARWINAGATYEA